jgi:hypothetical protein
MSALLLRVAEGILDNRHCERECSATAQAVIDYAETLDIKLSEAEANKVSIVINHYLDQIESNEELKCDEAVYFELIEKPLSIFEIDEISGDAE